MNPFKAVWEWLKAGWDIMRTVYWYNSLAWRFLKSGALVAFGFFCLAGGNLLRSYKPHWAFLDYVISYGFLLIVYGPIHHLIVIPGSLYLSHFSWGRVLRLGKRVPFWTLIGFFVAVGYFGYYPLDVMMFEFKAPNLGQSRDINPDVECYRTTDTGEDIITCQLPAVEGIERVEVENKGRTIHSIEDPPFRFTIRVNELEEVVGQKNFHVVLIDKNGSMIRRYVRSASMVEIRTPIEKNEDRSDTPVR